MIISAYKCLSAHERPDYNHLQTKSIYGTSHDRADIAERLIRDGHTDSRVFDNCFEMNDGDQVVCILVSRALRDDELRLAICQYYGHEQLSNGFPTRWLNTYNNIQNPLGLAFA